MCVRVYAMTNTSLTQKIRLIVFGVFLGVMLLEIGLRIGGYIYLYAQERANRISLAEKGEYVILCLGESTTQAGGRHSYPRQLEEILNERISQVRFTVINKGIAGTNTTSILATLEENLDKYKPDLVITMMGINDPPSGIVDGDLHNDGKKSFIENLRIFKLGQWLNDRIKYLQGRNKFSSKGEYCTANADADKTALRREAGNNDQSGGVTDKPRRILFEEECSLIEMGDYFLSQNQLEKAAEYFEQASSLDPERSFWRYLGLAVLYHRRYQDKNNAEKYYLKALEINPDHDAPYVYGEQESGLAALYREDNNLSQAEEMAKKAIEINPDNALAFSELGRINKQKGNLEAAIEMFESCINIDPNFNSPFAELVYLYRNMGRWEELEKLCLKIIRARPQDDRAYAALAVSYQQQGKEKLAAEYRAKVDKLRAGSYNWITVKNYRNLAETLKNRKIQLVCAQYPLRDPDDLKKILPDNREIIFVNNRDIFEDAVKHSRYSDIFSDQFAGDFGHCTPRGNRLLAENIANTLVATCFKHLTTRE